VNPHLGVYILVHDINVFVSTSITLNFSTQIGPLRLAITVK